MDNLADMVVATDVPELLNKAKYRADQTVEWLLDNGMVLSLQKSMFMVQATKELRRTKQIPDNLVINVGGVDIKCVETAKLLGLVLNQDMTWEHHLWGYKGEDDEMVPGLICMLSHTIGLLRKLALVLPTAQPCAVAMGLWQSRLLFGLALVGGPVAT